MNQKMQIIEKTINEKQDKGEKRKTEEKIEMKPVKGNKLKNLRDLDPPPSFMKNEVTNSLDVQKEKA